MVTLHDVSYALRLIIFSDGLDASHPATVVTQYTLLGFP